MKKKSEILLKIIDFGNRSRIGPVLRKLNDLQWRSKKYLSDYNNKKLRDLFIHSFNNVQYYREIILDLGIDVLADDPSDYVNKLPFLTKSIIRERFEDLKAKNITKFFEHGSSGSTGEYASFLDTKENESWYYGGELLGFSWAGYNVGDKHLNFGVSSNRGLRKIKDIILSTTYAPAFSLSDKTLLYYINKIKKKNIKVIVGYASSLYLMGAYCKKNNIHLDLKTIISHGEILFEHWRDTIENQFGIHVTDTYGTAGEGLFIASQCEINKEYHLITSNNYVEIINGDTPAKHNEIGEVIITNLNNFAMPLIRYKVGDMAKFSTNICECGRSFPLIKQIIGRDTDIVTTRSGQRLVVHVFTGLFEFARGIKNFQIIQNQIDSIVIKIVPSSDFNQVELDDIISEIKTYSNNELEIKIETLKRIPPSASQKRRLVISNLNNQ